MTPRQALLAEIRARPEDDAPRLVLADLLQQQGDPQGEFIAAQCRGDEARAHALWARHGALWCAAMGAPRERLQFERGLVRTLQLLQLDGPWRIALAEQPIEELSVSLGPSLPAPAALANLEALTRGWPLRRLALKRQAASYGGERPEGVELVLRALLAPPVLQRLRHVTLDLFYEQDAPDVWTFLQQASALESLSWSSRALHAGSLAHLLASEACRQLRRLVLKRGNSEEDEPLGAVLEALPATLRSLGVARSDVMGMRQWPPLPELEELDVFFRPPPSLLEAQGPGLRALHLRGPLEPEHLAAMAKLAGLRLLDLAYGSLDEETLVRLSRLPWFAQLDELTLSHSQVLGDPAPLLQIRPRALNLQQTRLTAAGLRRLAEAGALERVEELWVPQVDEPSMEALAERAPALHALHVTQSYARLASLRMLADRLRTLSLARFGPEEADALARVPFSRLERLQCLLLQRGATQALQRAPWFAGLEQGPEPGLWAQT